MAGGSSKTRGRGSQNFTTLFRGPQKYGYQLYGGSQNQILGNYKIEHLLPGHWGMGHKISEILLNRGVAKFCTCLIEGHKMYNNLFGQKPCKSTVKLTSEMNPLKHSNAV